MAQHPLAGVDDLLVFFPQAGFLPLKFADFCKPNGTQLGNKAVIGSPDMPAAAAMGVAGQGNVGVLRIQKGRGGVHLDVFKGGVYNIRHKGIECLLACLALGAALHHLPQAQEHAANEHQHKVAAKDHARHGDHAAQQRKKLAAQLAAFAFAQLLRELFFGSVRFLFCHSFLLIPPRRSGRGFP